MRGKWTQFIYHKLPKLSLFSKIWFYLRYKIGRPPWDTGRPQTEFIQLEQAGEIVGSVLDVGCGKGEDALYLAAHGHEVWGIDFTSLAIQKAKEKAVQRHLTATFLVLNVFELHTLGRTFDTVIDAELFHALSDAERALFVDNLATVMDRGATYFMLCFSDLEPGAYGPRRITQAEIKNSFQRGWHINYIKPATIDSWLGPHRPRAWLSSISKSVVESE
jgi:2-polyprenyl-3-methyl-5-hydroxy-6-metoxy-1,4-benzoquinol methylase